MKAKEVFMLCFSFIGKKILPYRVYYAFFEAFDDIGLLKQYARKIDNNCRMVANRLMPDYTHKDESTAFNAHELTVYSQNGEDGLLLYIFSKITPLLKTFVEFGVEDGRECNAANLAINFGWRGLLMDGSKDKVNAGRIYYKKKLGSKSENVKFIHTFITKENINEILTSNEITGEIDLLSIDIDGNDYWVWKEISVINPRVVVIEYNASFGSEKSVTIPYDPTFVWNSKKIPDMFFTGASLELLTRFAEKKGYVLVGCDSNGVNAFFVRNDVAEGVFFPASVTEAYFPHAVRTQRFGLDGQASSVEQLSLLEILNP